MTPQHLKFVTAAKEWAFEHPLSLNYRQVEPTDKKDFLLKELEISKVRVYWNSMSEMFIPYSLWDANRELEFQIFEAMPADSLREIMLQAFEPDFPMTYLVHPISLTLSISYYHKDNDAILKPPRHRLKVSFAILPFAAEPHHQQREAFDQPVHP